MSFKKEDVYKEISNRGDLIKVARVLEEINKLKDKVMDEINNPYTQEPKVHLGIVLKWLDDLVREIR